MPNWCENNLTIMGSKQQLDDLMSKVRTTDKDGATVFTILEGLYPRPFGEDWYSWNNENWGTKWGDCETQLQDDSDEVKEFTFLSAWSPPVEGIINISKSYPDLIFSMSWHEEGCDFWGATACQNGEGDYIEGYISDIEGMKDIDWDSDDYIDTSMSELIYQRREDAKVEMIRAIGDSAKVGS